MMKVLASSQPQMIYGITNFYSVRGKECEKQAKMSVQSDMADKSC
jgi:hypothetical protein